MMRNPVVSPHGAYVDRNRASVDRIDPAKRTPGPPQLHSILMHEGTGRRDLTIRDVAIASGVDRRTLTRQITDGVFPNAFRERTATGVAKGPWFIPFDDVVAAGIVLDESRIAATDATPAPDSLRAELDSVRAELAEERSRRRVAEALADERASAIEDLRDALKTMESLAAAATPDSDRAPQQPATDATRRPRLRGQWLR